MAWFKGENTRKSRSSQITFGPSHFFLSRPSGMETEMNKILSGFGDMYFYGHAGEDNKIIQYFVLDLDVFRDAVNNYRDTLKYKEKSNFDDSSRFVGFDIRSFQPSILIASNIEIKFQRQNHE